MRDREDAGLGYLRYEDWDATTPSPHTDDQFTCDQGCRWSRIHGDFGHGAAPISWHTGIRCYEYVNPPWFPVAEAPQPQPITPGQGSTRGSSSNWWNALRARLNRSGGKP
jgi:hypothetical protein